MTRSWPEPAQFNAAVQNLASSMSDPELQAGEPELGPLGVPMPYAGNFADVYKVHCPRTGNTWALKFFKREVRNLRERYRAISQCLSGLQLPFMVDFCYFEEGVRIGGEWYPLLKMHWIEGQNLNRFVAASLGQPELLNKLLQLWVKLAGRLRTAGIAHGDLQHGNVLLVPAGPNGRMLLRLVDYDGMFVPALAGQPPGEVGHAAYQHPQRADTQTYHRRVDRFSHLVICCALRCLQSSGRTLWERYDNGENLLFRATDFAQPAASALFRGLWSHRSAGARALTGRLLLATQQPLEDAPPIGALINGGKIQPLTWKEQRRVDAILEGEAYRSAVLPTNPQPLVLAEVADRLPKWRDLASWLRKQLKDHAILGERLGRICNAKFVMQTDSRDGSSGPRLLFDVVGEKDSGELLVRTKIIDGQTKLLPERITLQGGEEVALE